LDWTYSTYEQKLEKEYCGNIYNCEIDWSAKTSLKNLITQLDFYCAPVWQLGGIGFIFLVGIVVGCSTLTKLGDFYGRRPVFMLGYAMNFACIIALMFSHNVYVDYVILFCLGLSIAARYYVGYTYNVEMCPKA
jgi:MFS family permease